MALNIDKNTTHYTGSFKQQTQKGDCGDGFAKLFKEKQGEQNPSPSPSPAPITLAEPSSHEKLIFKTMDEYHKHVEKARSDEVLSPLLRGVARENEEGSKPAEGESGSGSTSGGESGGVSGGGGSSGSESGSGSGGETPPAPPPPPFNPSEEAKKLVGKTVVTFGKFTPPANVKDLKNPLAYKGSGATGEISFKDKYSEKQVTVTLKPELYQRLKDKINDGREIEKYVEARYYDAAYAVGYLECDADGDGKISRNEAAKLRALIDLNGEPPNNRKSLLEAFDGNMGECVRFLNEFDFVKDINEFINYLIDKDEDVNGTLEFKELVAKDKQSEQVDRIAEVVVQKKDIGLMEFNFLLLGKRTVEQIDSILSKKILALF